MGERIQWPIGDCNFMSVEIQNRGLIIDSAPPVELTTEMPTSYAMMGHQYIPKDGLIVPSMGDSQCRSKSPCGVEFTSCLEVVPSEPFDESLAEPMDVLKSYGFIRRVKIHLIDCQAPINYASLSSTFYSITDSLEMCSSSFSGPFPGRPFTFLGTTSSTDISQDFASLRVSPSSKSTPRKERSCVLKKSKPIGKKKAQKNVKAVVSLHNSRSRCWPPSFEIKYLSPQLQRHSQSIMLMPLRM